MKYIIKGYKEESLFFIALMKPNESRIRLFIFYWTGRAHRLSTHYRHRF